MPQHALLAMPPLENPEEKSEVPLEKKSEKTTAPKRKIKKQKNNGKG